MSVYWLCYDCKYTFFIDYQKKYLCILSFIADMLQIDYIYKKALSLLLSFEPHKESSARQPPFA